MKKVLALVLAVVMLCTMAFATDGVINLNPTTPPTPSEGPGTTYPSLHPGQTIAINLKDTDGNQIHNWYFKDGKFVPENNVLTVTFAKGSELIKSQGWVKLGENNYQYQITLKDDLTKVLNNKVADLQISAITVKSTGYNAVTIFKAAKAENYISYAVGYAKNEVTVKEGVTPSFIPGEITVVAKTLDKNDKEVASLEIKDGSLVYTVTKGMSFYTATEVPAFDASKDKGYDVNKTVAGGELLNTLNLPAKVTFAKGTNADKALNVYAKTVDGKILAVAATTTDGVMSFTVPAMSRVIITEATLTTTGTAGTTAGTTNPGTGANDVVGVAAALAVVALVSGAAISLKK